MAFAVGLRHRLSVADRPLLSGIKVFLFDCDGVIWKGSQAIPGAVDTLNYLKDAGKQVYYVVQLCSELRIVDQQLHQEPGRNCRQTAVDGDPLFRRGSIDVGSLAPFYLVRRMLQPSTLLRTTKCRTRTWLENEVSSRS